MKHLVFFWLVLSALRFPVSVLAASPPESFVHPQPATAFPFSYWKTLGASPTPSATPSASPTPNDYALLFSGSSQYVTIPNQPLNTNSDFTIEAWIKLGTNAFNVVYSGRADANNYWCLIVRSDGNGLCLQYAVASPTASFILTGSGTVTVAEGWTHIALTRSGNNWEIVKNGTSFKTATNSVTGLTTTGGSKSLDWTASITAGSTKSGSGMSRGPPRRLTPTSRSSFHTGQRISSVTGASRRAAGRPLLIP